MSNFPFGVPQEGVALEVVQGASLAPYTEFHVLLIGGALQRPISARRYPIESRCAYMGVFNSLSLKKFILGGDFVLTYWHAEDLTRQEDDDEYAQSARGVEEGEKLRE